MAAPPPAQAHITTIQLSHLPASHPLHIALFADVTNAAFLRQQLLDGNTDFEYAFVDARMVLSPTHLLAAAQRAATDMLAGRLRTRNVHSEVVLALGGSNNIASTLRTFGISETTTSLIALKLGNTTPTTSITSASVAAHLGAHVLGTSVPFSAASLAGLTDVPAVRRAYKIQPPGGGGGGAKGKRAAAAGAAEQANGGGDGDAERREAEVVALGMMALRGS